MTQASSESAVEARDVAWSYGDRRALDGVSFTVPAGGVHGFLGPNGSGKSTLFKLLATILPLREGAATMFGVDLARDAARVRDLLGVVFQSPALDRKLSVRRNLRYGGHLYGLGGAELERRIDEVLEIGGLADRAGDVVGELSGGLRRRAEIAKALLHRPRMLLLDEPSTGLDPAARLELWRFLRSQEGLTVLFTTHLMDEADDAERLTILDGGKVVAAGTPAELRAEIGGDVLEIQAAEPDALAADLAPVVGSTPRVVDGVIRVEGADAHALVAPIADGFRDRYARLSIGRPSLEDVFIARTGHRLDASHEEATR